MTSLRVTHTSTVTEDQIDHLGHMNVRYYSVNAQAATQRVLDDLEGWRGGAHVVHDIYTRHHREQMLGTPLVVRSALLGATDAGVRIHHELAPADADVLAATFVHVVSPLDDSGGRLPVPARAVAAAVAGAVEPPAYAAARTISLDADLMTTAPDLVTVRTRDLAMRRERAVDPSECDGNGRYRTEMAPMLTWGGETVEGDTGEHLHATADGQLMGWALMETRAHLGTLPHVGDRIQAFGAGIAIYDKVTHRVQWCFDVASGALISAFETVNMAFDIRARRPMSIPDGYRRREHERLHPDLAPRALVQPP